MKFILLKNAPPTCVKKKKRLYYYPNILIFLLSVLYQHLNAYYTWVLKLRGTHSALNTLFMRSRHIVFCTKKNKMISLYLMKCRKLKIKK